MAWYHSLFGRQPKPQFQVVTQEQRNERADKIKETFPLERVFLKGTSSIVFIVGEDAHLIQMADGQLAHYDIDEKGQKINGSIKNIRGAEVVVYNSIPLRGDAHNVTIPSGYNEFVDRLHSLLTKSDFFISHETVFPVLEIGDRYYYAQFGSDNLLYIRQVMDKHDHICETADGHIGIDLVSTNAENYVPLKNKDGLDIPWAAVQALVKHIENEEAISQWVMQIREKAESEKQQPPTSIDATAVAPLPLLPGAQPPLESALKASEEVAASHEPHSQLIADTNGATPNSNGSNGAHLTEDHSQAPVMLVAGGSATLESITLSNGETGVVVDDSRTADELLAEAKATNGAADEHYPTAVGTPVSSIGTPADLDGAATALSSGESIPSESTERVSTSESNVPSASDTSEPHAAPSAEKAPPAPTGDATPSVTPVSTEAATPTPSAAPEPTSALTPPTPPVVTAPPAPPPPTLSYAPPVENPPPAAVEEDTPPAEIAPTATQRWSTVKSASLGSVGLFGIFHGIYNLLSGKNATGEEPSMLNRAFALVEMLAGGLLTYTAYQKHQGKEINASVVQEAADAAVVASVASL